MKIFILTYDSRSGSTFFSRQLDQLKGVFVTPESAYITRLIEAERMRGNIFSDPESILRYLNHEVHFRELGLNEKKLIKAMSSASLNAGSIVGVITKEIAKKYSSESDGVMVIKTPVFDHFKEIKNLCFPEVKFIHLVRDPRAVHLSKMNSINIEGHPFSTNPLKTALKWRYKIVRAKKYSIMNCSEMITIRYEDLMEDTSREVSKCAKYFGVPFELGDSAYNENIGEAQSHLHVNVGKSAIKTRSDAWRRELSETDKRVISVLCKDQIIGLGYRPDIDGVAKAMPALMWMLMRYSLSSIIGMYNNFKNNPELVRKKISYLICLVTGK